MTIGSVGAGPVLSQVEGLGLPKGRSKQRPYTPTI